MSVLSLFYWESDLYWRQNNKHFAELATQNGGKQLIWRNYVTVTLCIVGLLQYWIDYWIVKQWRSTTVKTNEMPFLNFLLVLFLANNAIARPPVVCLSVVCNVRAPYSGGSNFRQYFYGIRHLGHPLTFTENFTEIVPGKPLRRGS